MKRLTPSSLYGDYPAQLASFTRVLPSGCWEFTGYVEPNGYGQLGRNISAHRLAWEVAHGAPVPAGLVVDHQCHNLDPDCRADSACAHRRCVNPDHLEAVPNRVNLIRGKGFAGINAAVESCPAGHLYDETNTYYRPDRIGRQCRICRYEAGRRSAEGHREQNRLRAQEYRRQANPLSFAIREWAKEAGLPCSLHGPISRAVREAYFVDNQRAA